MKFRFPVVIIDEDFRSENASGLGIRVLAHSASEDEARLLRDELGIEVCVQEQELVRGMAEQTLASLRAHAHGAAPGH